MGNNVIIENQLMWPPSCNRLRLDDEPRFPFDSMMHTLYTGCAKTMFVKPNIYLIEKEPLKFYDEVERQHICDCQVSPVLESAFWPGSDEPWNIDDKGRLFFLWGELLDFFTSLLWCSKLKMPFVFDLAALQFSLTNIRNDLVFTERIRDPRALNTLLTIMSLYHQKETWCLQPTKSPRGGMFDLWHELYELPTYRKLSRESRNLGSARASNIERRLLRTKKLATAAAENPKLKGALSVAKGAVGLFVGPIAKFGTDAAGKLASMVFSEAYIPPIYPLNIIEQKFDEANNPRRQIHDKE